MSEITPRVALVDDDDDLRAATAQWLSLAGFTVDSFAAAPPEAVLPGGGHRPLAPEVRSVRAPAAWLTVGFGLTVVTVTSRDAYPGTGQRRALVGQEGRGFGAALATGFADLVRQRGWVTTPIAADALAILNGNGVPAPRAGDATHGAPTREAALCAALHEAGAGVGSSSRWQTRRSHPLRHHPHNPRTRGC